jgi:hypothetical protein
LYTTEVDSIVDKDPGATSYVLEPLPDGYFYALTILNQDEQELISSVPKDGEPPVCETNQYYRSTMAQVKISLKSCDSSAPCNGEVIQIGDGASSSGPTMTHTKAFWLASALLAFSSMSW